MPDLLTERMQIAANMDQLKATAETAVESFRATSAAAVRKAKELGLGSVDDPSPDLQRAVRRWLRELQSLTGRICKRLEGLERAER